MLSWNEIKARAVQFSTDWATEKREDAEAQSFWNDFFNVFGVRRRTVATFEEKVRNIKGQFGSIDLFWRGKLLAEHKSQGKSLEKAASQAFEYIQCIKDENRDDEIPRYVIVSDFSRIVLYDLEPEEGENPVLAFPLTELHKNIHAFAFIPGYKVHRFDKEDPANIKAAELMGRIHDVLLENGYSGHDLERFLVRLLFCLFAEDTGIFESDAFTYFIENCTREDGSDLGRGIAELFEVLNTPDHQRQKNLDESLATMRYVNGGLFDEPLKMPACNRDIRIAILAATRFDWSKISPAVFGSLFQSIMNPKERRVCGAHYTTEANILKLINPLFMDDLWKEFQKIKSNRNKLQDFHQKIAKLKFFDPACGCGNFLVLAYRELRLLEMDVLAAIHKKDTFDPALFFHVDVDQFYGIEIVEFPVRIAETALWLMDHQMNIAAFEKFGKYFVRLPLQKTATIIHGNALRLDWNDVLPKDACSYILGNPPYVGKQYQSKEQKEDLKNTVGHVKSYGVLDYVGCWFIKAAEYINKTSIKVGFVATNSITQGEIPSVLWDEIYKLGIKIQFAYRTFLWTSEARGKAHVFCVIIGFSQNTSNEKQIFESIEGTLTAKLVKNINPYLMEGSDVAISSRSKPISDVPKIIFGSMPNDNGHFLFSDEEYKNFLIQEPDSKKWFRRFIGSHEFINGTARYCLWLQNVSPEELRACPLVLSQIKQVKEYRQKSKRATTKKLAKSSTEFGEIRQPQSQYIAIPRVSGERDYVPIGWMSKEVIASDALFVFPKATLFHFGVLTSIMHNAWIRIVGGRLGTSYRYSAKIVYNNFPWPDVTEKQRQAIEEKAQAVLDVRKQFPDSSFADLYDPSCMPPALSKAHRELDKAVDRAYRSTPFADDAERLAFLFDLYEKLIRS